MTSRKVETNDPGLQRLFERLNKKYFDGNLPHYDVFRSNRCEEGLEGLCRKKQREIHIKPDVTGSRLTRVLLHEMAHAASSRNGHGSAWLAEMDRLAKLGAPTRSEWRDYQKTETTTISEMCFEAEEHGLMNPDVPWPTYRIDVGKRYGLCDHRGRSESPRAARYLTRIRRAFLDGQTQRGWEDSYGTHTTAKATPS